MTKLPSRRPTRAQRLYLERLRRKHADWEAALWCNARPDGHGGYYRLPQQAWVRAAWRKALRKARQAKPWPYGLPPGALDKYKRGYRHGHPEALTDAVRAIGKIPIGKMPRCLRDGLAARARDTILGVRKKSGPRTDWRRDCIWFMMVQERVDGGMKPGKAIEQACLELKWENRHDPDFDADGTLYDTLKAAYYRTKKRLRRDSTGAWVPRKNVYIPESSF